MDVFCIKCGKEIQPTDKFCPYCGSPCQGTGQPVKLAKNASPEPEKPAPENPAPPAPKSKTGKKGLNAALIGVILALVIVAAGAAGLLLVRSGNEVKLKEAATNSVTNRQMAQIREIYSDYFASEGIMIQADDTKIEMKSNGLTHYILTVPALVMARDIADTYGVTITAKVDTNWLLTEYSIQPDIEMECELPYTVGYPDFAGSFVHAGAGVQLTIEVTDSDMIVNGLSIVQQTAAPLPELVRNHIAYDDAGVLNTLKYVPAAFSAYGVDTVYQTVGENGTPSPYIRSDGIAATPSLDGSDAGSDYTMLDYSWIEGSYLQSGSPSTVLSLQFDSWNPWESSDRWYVRFSVTENGLLTGNGLAYYSGGDSLPRLDGDLTYGSSPITLKYDGSGFTVTCAELNLYDAYFYSGTPSATPAYVNSADYIIPDSSWRVLTDMDVIGLTVQEVNYAKNEIYARHGRRFLSEELQAYFDSKSWYLGTVDPADFTESMLSEIEKQNVTFLSGIENSLKGN